MKIQNYVIIFFILMILINCDNKNALQTIYEDNQPVYKKGDKLEYLIKNNTQPESLSEYSELMTLCLAYRIALFNMNKTTELLKIIELDMAIRYAKMDKNGFLWVASQFGTNIVSNPHQYFYIINPYENKVHKVIKLPHELRRPSGFIFTDDKVYIRGDRRGFSVGLGSIDRNDYSVEVITEIDSLGFLIKEYFIGIITYI